jgi:ferredoxin-NADP reductase/MOSC domain-containing protein YiiM
MVRRLNIDGDGQGDLNGHGGERRAVFVYQMDSYRYWQSHLGRDDFIYGQFGENFTVDGLPDSEVCIGDRYRIGGALFEVTQPRVTCYRLGIRMNEPEMAALVVKHGRPGFYFRVLEEGEVETGDEITQVASGPERMSVSEIDGLLYKPGHPRGQLERALRIPALSVGWRRSLEALLTQQREGGATTGNAGLGAVSGPPPAWRGFRPLRISRKLRESGNVTSLLLEPTDGEPVPAPLPGQFVVLRLRPPSAPELIRSYSLSGAPDAATYRVSVKREAHGAASAYVDNGLQVGDVVQATSARGDFTLRPGDTPVVLLSAGIGVTPVLAMLHALAAEASRREVWWLYGTRNGREHPFAEETRGLLDALPHHHRHICYSSPDPQDRANVDFDAPGHLNPRVLGELKLPRNGDFYICGPSAFDRSDCRAHGIGRHAELHPYRDVRCRSVHYPRHCGRSTSAAALAGKRSRLRTDGFVYPQRSQRPLGIIIQQPARARRGVRRTCALCVSNRGLPHLRERVGGRKNQLPPGPGRRAGGRHRADLLRAARGRRRNRFVTARSPGR